LDCLYKLSCGFVINFSIIENEIQIDSNAKNRDANRFYLRKNQVHSKPMAESPIHL